MKWVRFRPLAFTPSGILPEQGAFAELQGAHRFLQSGLKTPGNGHDFTGGFHLAAELSVTQSELVKGPSGNLDHAVV